MKIVHHPGVGFPKRLQALLHRLGKRPADVDRDTKGVVKADTVSNWLKGKHYPEKFMYYQFCRAYRLDSTGAWELLYGPKARRDEAYLERPTDGERLLATLDIELGRVEDAFHRLPGNDQEDIRRRLQEALTYVHANGVTMESGD